MNIICGIFLVLFLLLYCIGIQYKKEARKQINKKEHSLIYLYGMSMFIIDKCLNFKGKKEKITKIIFENSEINSKLECIYINGEENEKYLYYVKKVSIVILVITIGLVIGVCGKINYYFNSEAKIIQIERNNFGKGKNTYNFTAILNNKKENISVSLDEKKYTETEAYEILDKAFVNIKKKVLGDNESENKVSKPLNFVNKEGENINVTWKDIDENVIDYNGNIKFENIDSEYIDTSIILGLEICGYEKEYKITYRIVKKDEDNNLSKIITKWIDEHSELTDKIVKLPDVIQGEDVTYYKSQDDYSDIIIILSIIIAGIIYFLKDRDLDKLLEKRKEQLSYDYAVLVNKITLLQGAGMTLFLAWNKVVEDYEKSLKNSNKDKYKDKRYVYEEMKKSLVKIQNGVGEGEEYSNFGKRCGLREYIKFGNLLEQNLKKGTSGLKNILESEVYEAFEERKVIAKKSGDEAGTKLLFPMIIMLIISIVIIIVPAFMSISI